MGIYFCPAAGRHESASLFADVYERFPRHQVVDFDGGISDDL